MARVILDHVTKRYDAGAPAVADVSLAVEDGEFLVLVGPSGCGKSTTLRLIAGLEEVTSGEITIGSHEVTALPPKARDVAMVFQNAATFPYMSVADNIGFGLKLRHRSKAEIGRRVAEVAGALGLSDLLDRRPGALSGGQRQRVAIGRAMLRDPQVFLMDEPLSSLDARLRVQMRTEIARLQRRLGTTTLYVTHDQEEAMTLGHRLAILNSGVLEQIGTPDELYRQPATLFVGGFIGSPQMNVLDATVRAGQLCFGPVRLSLAAVGTSLPEGSRLRVGIRPSDLSNRIGDGLVRIGGVVDVVEHLGSQVQVRVDLGDGARAHDWDSDAGSGFTARLDTHPAIRARDRIDLAFDPARLYLFDADTGRAIRS